MRYPPTRIAWMPPFSLDLTGLMVDILYCIRVVNITGGTDEFLYGHCNVTTPYFDDDSLSCQGCLYEITVTSYSNGGGSLNGTPSTWRGMSVYLIFKCLTHTYDYDQIRTYSIMAFMATYILMGMLLYRLFEKHVLIY